MTSLAVQELKASSATEIGLPLLRTRVRRIAAVVVFTAILGGLSQLSTTPASADLRLGGLVRIPWWVTTGTILVISSLFPAKRRVIVAIAALLWVVAAPPVERWVLREMAQGRGAVTAVKFWPVGVVLVWGLAFALLWVVRNRPKSTMARRPLVTLVLLLVFLLGVTQLPLRGVAWVISASAAMAMSSYLWFFAYWLTENGTSPTGDALWRTGFWRPFWGFTRVPFGKGATYLERVEAKDDLALAATQLKGLKLLVWAAVLTGVVVAVNVFIYRVPAGAPLTQLPRTSPDPLIFPYPQAIDRMQGQLPLSIPMRWGSLILWFLMHTATLTVFGGTAIAIARMAGFNAFRNTCRPFESTTIAEFYNRIYYYFKELLVTFFFFPTYLRYFKKHPRLRLFAATLAAAGFGNWMFHLLRDSTLVIRKGAWYTLELYLTYGVYAVILGVAISLSQLRILKNRGKSPTGLRRYLAIAAVLFFYCLISVFQEPNPQHGLGDYMMFLVKLFWP